MILWHLLVLLLAGGGLAWLSERISKTAPRVVALLFLTLCLGYLLFQFAPALGDYTSTTTHTWMAKFQAPWIPRFGIQFALAIDPLSFLLVVLTLFLGGIATLSSWDEIEYRPGFFYANLLWTLSGVLGVFFAVDLFLFFICWEVMLVPMYLLIAIWGHEGRAYAAMKFFIFTQFSGLLMLVAIISLAYLNYRETGISTFSYFELLASRPDGQLGFFLMLGFFLAFTVKLPAFPFHTWLPDAHTQAPTAGSVLLAGILLKTGAYGLIRFALPLFPEQSLAFSPVAITMGVAGILYGAILAFGQNDFKRLVAYSSVSHMGFVLLGLYAWNEIAAQGAIMQLFAHGLSTAALFMTAGALQMRLHTRDMNRMGGLWANMPRMGAVSLFFVAASLGMPGLGNFIAEFLVLLGLFRVHPVAAAIAAIGLVTAAVYALTMMQRAFQGTPDLDRTLPDYGAKEMCAMGLMMIGLLYLGLYPQDLFDLTRALAINITQTGAAVGSP